MRGTEFDKDFEKFGRVAFGIWAVALLISLGLVVVIAWAVIRLVLHFT